MDELGIPVPLERLDALGKDWEETKGPMQYVGEGLHATAKGVGHYGLGMSEANAETFATATMDGVNIVTAGRMLKPGVAPALKAAGTVVKTATKAAVAALETPLGLVKQLEITRQPGTMGMAGIGTFKIGTKATAPTIALESTVSGAPVKFDPTKIEIKDFKKSDFQKGDNIGLHRFTQKGKDAKWIDPKSGQYIQKDWSLNSGAGPHGPSRWKLYDRTERLLGTITKEGSFYKGAPK